MGIAALVCNLLATMAALYDGKLLVWNIAVADLRASGSGLIIVIVSVLVTAAFVALPVWAGLRLAATRPILAFLLGLVSLALSGGGFFILASAFTP